MKNMFSVLFAAMLALGSSSVFAGEKKNGTELLFDTGSLNGVKTGEVLSYAHSRNADDNIPTRPLIDGEIQVRIAEEDSEPFTEVTLVNGKAKRKLHRFPANQGNPIFVAFLESSVSSVAFATKGSPFYIRNRIKDAFGQGGEITEVELTDGPATQITYHPFKGDRNAAKIGRAFEALTMTFVLSDDTQGKFVSLTTEATIDGTEYFKEEVRYRDAKPSKN